MLRTFTLASLVLATITVLSPITAWSDDSGMAGIHDWQKVGRKTCFVGHFHTGTTTGYKRSKRLAMKDAITSWQEFTAAEYGTDWAYFRHAIHKGANCERNRSGWNCYVEGIACNRKRKRR